MWAWKWLYDRIKLAWLSDYLLLLGSAPVDQLLGSFAGLRKETIGFVRSVCPPVLSSFHPSACNNLGPSYKNFHKIWYWRVIRRVREIAKKPVLASLRLSIRTERLSSHWRIFMKSFMSIFQKSVEKIQVSLQSDKNNGYFTRRPIYIVDHISLSSCLNEKWFMRKL
jgi:hypothetical protein